MNPLEKIIVIVGPTGVGKTALSIALAQQLNGEIINADSLQVYQTLDIGTAKVTEQEANGVPHHLLDICSVEEEFTASDFKLQARAAIRDILSRGKLPIVVGGTGLYIEGLLFDFHFSGENSNDSAYRREKEKELETIGPMAMWEQLKTVDPQSAAVIHPNNTRRVIRALEVTHASGKPFSSNSQQQKENVYHAYLIGLTTERTALYERINQRVTTMDESGLEAEAKQLYEIVRGTDAQSIRGIGYKEWIPYFEGQESKENVLEKIRQDSRRYAKRQLTWFRNRMEGIHWYDLVAGKDTTSQIIDDCQEFLEK